MLDHECYYYFVTYIFLPRKTQNPQNDLEVKKLFATLALFAAKLFLALP